MCKKATIVFEMGNNFDRFYNELRKLGERYGYIIHFHNIVSSGEYYVKIHDTNDYPLVNKYVEKVDIVDTDYPEEFAFAVFSNMLASVGIDVSNNEEENEN